MDNPLLRNQIAGIIHFRTGNPRSHGKSVAANAWGAASHEKVSSLTGGVEEDVEYVVEAIGSRTNSDRSHREPRIRSEQTQMAMEQRPGP